MIPYWTNGRVVLWQGHVLACLAAMEAGSVHCVATSPPYYSLRDYDLPPVEWPAVSYAPMAGLPPLDIPGCDPECGHVWGPKMRPVSQGGQADFSSSTLKSDGRPEDSRVRTLTENAKELDREPPSGGQYCQLCGGWRGCLGLEPTPEMFVGHIVLVARELWRVLRDDGCFFLNFGDSYAGSGAAAGGKQKQSNTGSGGRWHGGSDCTKGRHYPPSGLKEKDLIGIPWRVAFALQADGWYLRSDLIWAKGVSFCPTYSGSCMPESVRDRPTKGHEYVFLLTKNKRYFYDATAVRESCGVKPESRARYDYPKTPDLKLESNPDTNWKASDLINWPADGGRNLRTVWTINPGSYAGAHFATFPPALVEPMIKAGTSQRGCCPKCLSPWVRVTSKEFVPQQDVSREKGVRGNGDQKPLDKTDGREGYPRGTTAVTTTGWTPTCSCYDWEHCAVCNAEMDDYDQEHGDRLDCGHNICAGCLMAGEAGDHVRECELAPVPCTVLDPFFGSGTTGQVALKLGRKVEGIELSKSYCDDHIIPRLSKGIQMEMGL